MFFCPGPYTVEHGAIPGPHRAEHGISLTFGRRDTLFIPAHHPAIHNEGLFVQAPESGEIVQFPDVPIA